ncbi:hypothetical protein PV336_16375 [Streptomyces sp. MI02-2A]|uniref:hypothetical protein n=1 Tax=Streptomyces sp. MI02-2A TaxID=3028688 RepID=UPI0029A5BC10|nr:hypothetical protein [Streptomyces sp. MI02-2A]MDX3260798.1 hypothetical protein [Streptomyces sp. MI02-2A]
MSDAPRTQNETKLLYIREFLNNEGVNGLAAILADVDMGDTNEQFLDFGASITLSDCNRTVELDFSAYGSTGTKDDRDALRKDIKNARDKADRLLVAMTTFVARLNTGLMRVENELDLRDERQGL